MERNSFEAILKEKDYGIEPPLSDKWSDEQDWIRIDNRERYLDLKQEMER